MAGDKRKKVAGVERKSLAVRDGLRAYIDGSSAGASAVSLVVDDSGVVDSPAKDYKDQSDGRDVSDWTL